MRRYFQRCCQHRLVARGTLAAGAIVLASGMWGLTQIALMVAAMGYIFALIVPAFSMGQVTTFERCLPATLAQVWGSRMSAYLATTMWAVVPLAGFAVASWATPALQQSFPFAGVGALALLVPVFPITYAFGYRWIDAPSAIVRVVAGVVMVGMVMTAYVLIIANTVLDPDHSRAATLAIAGVIGAFALMLAPVACRIAGRVPRRAGPPGPQRGPTSRTDAPEGDPFSIGLQTTAARATRMLSGRLRWYAVTFGADWRYWCAILTLVIILMIITSTGNAGNGGSFWLLYLCWGMEQGFEQRVRRISAHRFVDRWKAAALVILPPLIVFGVFAVQVGTRRVEDAPVIAWSADPGSSYFDAIGLKARDVDVRDQPDETAQDILSRGPQPASQSFLAEQLARLAYRDAGVRVEPETLMTSGDMVVTTGPITGSTAEGRNRATVLMLLTAAVLMGALIAMAIPGRSSGWRSAGPWMFLVVILCLIVSANLQDDWITVSSAFPYPEVPVHWHHQVRAYAINAYVPVAFTLAAAIAVLAGIIVRRSRNIEFASVPAPTG